MAEVVPLVEQRLSHDGRECVREAIAEVELCRMPASLAEVPVRHPRDVRLLERGPVDDGVMEFSNPAAAWRWGEIQLGRVLAMVSR